MAPRRTQQAPLAAQRGGQGGGEQPKPLRLQQAVAREGLLLVLLQVLCVLLRLLCLLLRRLLLLCLLLLTRTVAQLYVRYPK